MTPIRGGITAPLGFLAAGIHAGIKKRALPDLALIVSERAGPVAAVFTQNRLPAAPVLLDRLHLRGGRARAVIINSGNANACTGTGGLADAQEMARLVARALRTDLRTVFVGSTGVIGQRLPMAKIKQGIPAAVAKLSRSGGRAAARAIMTTDTRPKEIAVRDRIGGRSVSMGGIAKGAGMIHPDMATLLAYVTTDAAIGTTALRQALAASVGQSFNRISIDGDTSTNDTVLCIANGLAGNRPIVPRSRDAVAFQRMLDWVCRRLAMEVCWDGEGVTKVVDLVVSGANTRQDARRIARTVATSPLVKTALFGQDANWGRIMAAIGRAGVRINPAAISLAFGGVPIVRRGVSLGPTAEARIARVARRKEFSIAVDLGQGRETDHAWFTDLSFDYVKINASYRT